ncbi:hypothetical protein QN219_07910 [Sinorhizobium sp. 7-81]|uniref:hypothetical protein n=1 Tax=Sinorhizobium sp. 8-89 TaxID=3049089 RepID=UPI0024C2393D|nr:hypothetical protein [Sinorhizobium sp. 8-89]MDK1489980.1 hypothetical protein [Sinorhizobium sp. 8-89]
MADFLPVDTFRMAFFYGAPVSSPFPRCIHATFRYRQRWEKPLKFIEMVDAFQ